MQYPFNTDSNLLTVVTYGSHLYGAATPTSDYDFKGVFLPEYKQLMLNKQLHVVRKRYKADGSLLGDHETMPPNGWEVELSPVQKFVHDYLGGQAWAVELAFAVVQGAHELHLPPPATSHSRRWHEFRALSRELTTKYLHRNVNGMVGFAVKQTFDYVRRGERLNAARVVLAVVDQLIGELGKTTTPNWSTRLDTPYGQGTVLDELVKLTGLEVGSTVNHNKAMRTLKLNGRDYLETTTLVHFRGAVEKLIDQYGERSTRASETDVDWKSLSHAVRVYQQVIELLQTGFINFPRQNGDVLRAIKLGQKPLEGVKDLLRDLDDTVQDLVATSTLPTPDELRDDVDTYLFNWLERQY